MHQDITWYGGRPQPGDFVLYGDPTPLPKRGGATQFSAYVYCGLTAGRIKIPLGTEVGLGQNDTVLHGDPAPPKKGTAPNFLPMCIVVKRLYVSGYHLVRNIQSQPYYSDCLQNWKLK